MQPRILFKVCVNTIEGEYLNTCYLMMSMYTYIYIQYVLQLFITFQETHS